MNNSENLLRINQKHPFLWIGMSGLGFAYALVRLNIYLGTQVNYLDYQSLFNVLTFAICICAGAAIITSIEVCGKYASGAFPWR